ncbi:MAG: hypothetical protein PHD43_23565 [Methylococcales bacterium]|nr:hypothetical protein [Methylococcales bacterium]
MSQNLTQPEEIDHILLEMAWRDMKMDTPDYPLDTGRTSTQHANPGLAEVIGLKTDLHRIDFGGAALADENPN